ncbi:hypothetical protein AXG93_4111s1000 [Marchantia polymorpha subsp. ruderalis]|uniref:Bromo domain-containing protein n=1 Tax=Marchantia polymorpha subsp. ruderalis TaxID=1480154 RepID=A0A176VMB4_MARPO|nr:hypothetical protein AXG93_4111s1000 [Marchantia polymorpha subsp. ruderalis]
MCMMCCMLKLISGCVLSAPRKDTYGVFAEPVDAAQVPDYYDFIKDPMDFGTMRKKINKNAYSTMESFEVGPRGS